MRYYCSSNWFLKHNDVYVLVATKAAVPSLFGFLPSNVLKVIN